MTLEHAPFLKAIVANPDDDLPRLVYADWLDERGEYDRAEFIRVQIEIARIGRELDCKCEDMEDWRSGEFGGLKDFGIEVDRTRFTRKLDAVRWRVLFVRGFVEEVRVLRLEDWLCPCLGCDVSPGVRRELRMNNNVAEVPCWDCNGTGYTFALARQVVENLPTVRRVWAADCEPYSFTADGSHSAHWYAAETRGTIHPASDLPPLVFGRLKKGKPNGQDFRVYEYPNGVDEANQDLSDVLLELGRPANPKHQFRARSHYG